MQCFRVGYRGICHASLVLYVWYTRDGSQELKSFGAGFWRSPQRYPSKVLRASNDGKVEWDTTAIITIIITLILLLLIK